MALYRNPQFGAEPYQESQGAQLDPSPVELQAFYEVQRRESQERRLTKRKSGGSTASWARKSLKRSPTVPASLSYVTGPPPPSQPTPSPQHTRSLSQDTARHAQHFEMGKLEDQKEKFQSVSQMNLSTSVVPDSDLPAWYHKDIWASVPTPKYKASYRLHNPVGPRWYRNYHLIPPSQLRPATRPPSVFSPSFPPMATTSMPERSLDSRMAGPSRTPSGSPLPTPSSSQTRVADAAQKPRSRKPSLTTADGLELDITDPWGATWHHSSPYDFSITATTTATSASEKPASRPRRASLTGFQIKRKAAPSPLSQSTSAVHLQPPSGPNILRKLSKRKTATIGAIFRNNSENKRNAVSLPVTPVDGPSTTQSDNVDPHGVLVAHPGPSTVAVSSSSASIMTKASKKEKRGSVLGRLVKKLSILRKTSGDAECVVAKDDWHHISLEGPTHNSSTQAPLIVAEPASIGDVNHDFSPSLNEPVPHVSQDADRSSSISLEVPFATGRLTVANPDLPSIESTPIGPELPLPPEKPDQSAEPKPSPILSNDEALYENSIQPSLRPLARSALSHEAQSSQPTDPIIIPAPPEQIPHNDIYDNDVEESLPPTPPAKSRAPSPALPPPVLSPEYILHGALRSAQSPASSAHDSSTINAKQANGHSTADVLASPSGAPTQALSQSVTPFSLNDDSVLVPPRLSYVDSFHDSPLSISSLDVGPPTPYHPVIPIPTSPRPHRPHPQLNDILSSQTRTVQSTRKTETLNLVRGTPGHVLGSVDAIVDTIDKSMDKARMEEQKGGRRKTPEARHERGEERPGREQEHQRVWESERPTSSEARMKEHHRNKERRIELSHEDKERRKEGSHDEIEERRRQAEKERERQKEREREREAERERERLREQKERERDRERQRQMERERERERHREKEKEREKERQKEKEREHQKERERQREKERERERQQELERERERQKEKERERQKEKERERQKEKERERQKEKEREHQKEQERERERQKEKERRQKEREREREKARQKEKEHEEREREQRAKEKSRDRERRDQERRSRHGEEVQRHRTASQSHVYHRHDTREGSTSTLPPEMGTSEAHHGHQRTREREGHRIKWPERKDGELPPVPTQPIERPPLQRNSSSTSTRPTSELPSAAELMALRAKEAYEMDRLFKARSMYGQEPEGTSPNSISSNLSEKGSTAGAIYGSGHTAYVFNPLSRSRDALHTDRPFSCLSDLATIPSLDSPPNRPLSNPLPDPPRQSTYQPMPLAILESSNAQTSDYWTKYTITTAQ